MLGDYNVGATIYGKFTTISPFTGSPFTCSGSPGLTLSVYKDNTTAPVTSGVTLTTDFNSVVGLNHFAIDTSVNSTFYSYNSNFDIVLSSGMVDQVSLNGMKVGHFTLNKSNSGFPAYYANIKYVKDNINNADEFTALWYKDNSPVASSQLTNPALSVFNTSNGTALITNQPMSYASNLLGTVRYNGSLVTASGESYLVSVSGTIDGSSKNWQLLVGLDSL